LLEASITEKPEKNSTAYFRTRSVASIFLGPVTN